MLRTSRLFYPRAENLQLLSKFVLLTENSVQYWHWKIEVTCQVNMLPFRICAQFTLFLLIWAPCISSTLSQAWQHPMHSNKAARGEQKNSLRTTAAPPNTATRQKENKKQRGNHEAWQKSGREVAPVESIVHIPWLWYVSLDQVMHSLPYLHHKT